MSQDERTSDQIVARVAAAVFMDNPAQLRAAVPDFQEELQHWPMKNPRATWDEVTARLVLEVDVTADDRAVLGRPDPSPKVVLLAKSLGEGRSQTSTHPRRQSEPIRAELRCSGVAAEVAGPEAIRSADLPAVTVGPSARRR